MRSRLIRRLTAGLAAVTVAATLAVFASTPAFAGGGGRPCSAGVWTQVAFYFNPFWPVFPRVTVSGSTFDVRYYGTAVPPYWEADTINGFADVIISPSVGTTLEVRCRTNATFTG